MPSVGQENLETVMTSRMPTVKNVGEPCAGEPHARIEVAAGGNRASRHCRTALAPSADPTSSWAAAAYISAAARRTRAAAGSPNKHAWTLSERSTPLRFLIHDRDSKFTRDFDAVFRGEGIEIVRTPIRAPKSKRDDLNPPQQRTAELQLPQRWSQTAVGAGSILTP
jgi:hypothetical protein